MAFRQAHKVIGKIVSFCTEKNTDLTSLTPKDLQQFSDLFENDVNDIFSFEGAIGKRNIQGGTGHGSVAYQIETARKLLKVS